MLLTSSDTSITRHITLVYCLSSCVLLSALVLIFYYSGTYVLIGKSRAWPMFIPIILFEIVKWCLHHVIYEKDLKIRKANRFSNWSVVIRHIDILEIVKGMFICCVGCVLFFVMAVLFGAEISSKHEETLMFAVLVTFLTVFPMTLHSGRHAFVRFVADQPPPNMFHKIFYRTLQLTLIGAWIGAVFIPLDWDRPWQAWPITSSSGAFIGNIVGYVFILLQHFVFSSLNIFGKKKKSVSVKYN